MDIIKLYNPDRHYTSAEIATIENYLKYYKETDCTIKTNSISDTYNPEYNIHYMDNEFLRIKIYYGPSDSFLYNELQNEILQNLFIESLINKKKLSPTNYLRMIEYKYCHQSDPHQIGYIIYPTTQYSYNSVIVNKDNIINKILTQLVILYQTTGRIHGNFTFENINLIEQNKQIEPVITGFGRMRKGTCLDHVKEFIGFILQIANRMAQLKKPIDIIQPDYIKNLIGLNYLQVNEILNKITQSQIDEIYNYWIFNK